MIFHYLKVLIFMPMFFHMALYSVDFVLFTEPKTGTHLLINVLKEFTGRTVYWPKEYMEDVEPISEPFEKALENNDYIFFSQVINPWKRCLMDHIWKINKQQGTFLHVHPPYSVVLEEYLAKRHCINFFVKRDPRDQIVSLLNHYKNIHFNDQSIKQISSDDERLVCMIKKQLRKQTLCFMGWLDSPVCCVLDFSRLMGSHGGAATDEDAIGEMRKIANALGMNCTNAYLKRVYEKSFGSGRFFFKGKVGSWKEYFNEEHKAVVKEEIGDLLIELGYENDYNW